MLPSGRHCIYTELFVVIKPNFMKKIGLLLIIAFISCKSPTEKNAYVKSIELEHLEARIDSLFNSKIGENEPGAAILVSYDGEMLIGKGFGLRDLEDKKPVSINTNFRMGSISKQFTALSILSLVDKGILSLHDSVDKFWPYLVFKDITIEQLLNHTSGLAAYDPYFQINWDRNNIAGNKDILDWLSTNPTPSFKAGSSWEYSNTGYIVLAHLVEKVSGKEFSAYAQENVFQKAGMENTTYYSHSKPIEISERAYCYSKDSLETWEKVDGYFLDGIMGGGGAYTSIIDYFNYNIALQNQVIVSTDMHKIIFKPNTEALPEKEAYQFDFLNGEEQRYAMGWFVTNKIALHGGSWNGARTMVVKELERPLTIAIFLNFNSTKIRNKLIESTHLLVDEYLKTTANKVNKK